MTLVRTNRLSRRYHLHWPAVAYLVLVVLIGVTAMNNQQNMLFWAFGVMLAGLAISGVLSGLMMLGLDVKRIDPDHGSVGEPLLVQYQVSNHRRFTPLFDVHIDELPVPDGPGWQLIMARARAWIMHCGPKETVHGEAVYWPVRRGEIHFQRMRAWTTFPFGLVKKSVTFDQPQHTLVYPMLYELRRDVLEMITPQGPVGMKISQRQGGGDDYYGMREYRPGDSMRHIAWKRSAMRDDLVTVERSRPSPPKIRIVLNLTTPTNELPAHRHDPVLSRELEERAISLAASIAHAATLVGFEIGLSVQGFDLPSIPIRRSHWHVERIMAALAGIDLNLDRDQSLGQSPADLERAGVVIIHPDHIDPETAREDAVHFSARQIRRLTEGKLAVGGRTRMSSAETRMEPAA